MKFENPIKLVLVKTKNGGIEVRTEMGEKLSNVFLTTFESNINIPQQTNMHRGQLYTYGAGPTEYTLTFKAWNLEIIEEKA